MESVAPILTTVDKITRLDTGNVWIRGRFGSLYVTVGPWGLRLQGSLPKWYTGSNVQACTFPEWLTVLDRLEDALPVSIRDSYVSRVDVAVTLLVPQLPSVYLSRLGPLCRYKQDNHGGTIYYRQLHRRVVLYDKGAEIEKERAGARLPVEYGTGYGLRVEIRYEGEMTKQFGRPVTVGQLRDKETFLDRLSKVETTFQAIHKTTKESVNVKNREDARMELCRAGLESMGGAARYIKEKQADYKAGRIPRHVYRRIKEDVERYTKGAGGDDAVVSELKESARVEFSRLRESAVG